MKIITVIGDSHVWGDGAGAEYHFVPKAVEGDLRMADFGYPTYVNLLRDAYALSGQSDFSEYTAKELADIIGCESSSAAELSSRALDIKGRFALARVFFIANSKKTEVCISVDGKEIKRTELFETSDAMNKCIRICNIKAEDAEHVLSLSGEGALVQRIELYSKDLAIVNCGVGSCKAGQYLDNYFHDYAEDIAPYAILFEGCTINDWLKTETVQKYKEDLSRIIARMKELTPRVLVHTPFPVYGEQINKFGIAYIDYINALRDATKEHGLPLIDTYEEIEELILSTPEEKREKFLYRDRLHPNVGGHFYYAKFIFPKMKEYLK